MSPESLKSELNHVLEMAKNEESNKPGIFIRYINMAISEIDKTDGQIRRIWVEFTTKLIYLSGVVRDILSRKRGLLNDLMKERSITEADDYFVFFGLFSAVSNYFGVLPRQQGSSSVNELFTKLFTSSEDYTPTHQELIPVESNSDYTNFERISQAILEMEQSFDQEAVKNELTQSIEEYKEAVKMLKDEEKKNDEIFREYSSSTPSGFHSRISVKSENQVSVGDVIKIKVYALSHSDTPCDVFLDEIEVSFSLQTSWKIVRKSQGVYLIRSRPKQEGVLNFTISIAGEQIPHSYSFNVTSSEISDQYKYIDATPSNFKVEPFGICTTNDDKILICVNIDNKEGKLGILQSNKFTLIEGKMTRPYNIAVDDKIWYVSDVDGPNKTGRIHVFVDGKYNREIQITSKSGEVKTRAFDQPRGLGILKSKNLVVSEGGKSHRISIIDPNTGQCLRSFGRFGSKPGEFNWPASIAVDSKDRIIVADENNHRYQIFDEYGNLLGLFGKQGTEDGDFNGTAFGPFGVCVDSNDNIYTVDQFAHRIQVFSPEGIFLSKMGDQSYFANPFCITVKGREIYITDRKKKIAMFNSESEKLSRKRLTSKSSIFPLLREKTYSLVMN